MNGTSERVSQSEKALQSLRSLILGGSFVSGARLPEISLADRIGVSRTPLRKAMDRLVEEGLLERRSGGGCQVASFSREDVADAIEIRGVLEGTAARLAAERGVEPDRLAEMLRLLEDLDGCVADVDVDVYVRLNGDFHDLMASLPDSPIVKREVERVKRLPLASPSALLRVPQADFLASLVVAQQQHWAVFDAISNRQGARAEAIAREHARIARRNLDLVDLGEPSLVHIVPGLALVGT